MLNAECAADFHFYVLYVEWGLAGFKTEDHAASVVHAVFLVDFHFVEGVAGEEVCGRLARAEGLWYTSVKFVRI